MPLFIVSPLRRQAQRRTRGAKIQEKEITVQHQADSSKLPIYHDVSDSQLFPDDLISKTPPPPPRGIPHHNEPAEGPYYSVPDESRLIGLVQPNEPTASPGDRSQSVPHPGAFAIQVNLYLTPSTSRLDANAVGIVYAAVIEDEYLTTTCAEEPREELEHLYNNTPETNLEQRAGRD